jgi:hypothetical protein
MKIPDRALAARSSLASQLFPPVTQHRNFLYYFGKREGGRYGADAFSPLVSAERSKNICGIGVGLDPEKPDDKTVRLQVLVRKKLDRASVPESERIPEMYDGLPVMVTEAGNLRRFVSRPSKQRPIIPGLSIGAAARNEVGTLGAILVDSNDVRYVLSNNHVLAAENALPVGSYILQPAVYDDGAAEDRVGSLSAFIDLKTGGSDNVVDCAVARIDENVSATNNLPNEPKLNGTREAEADLRVFKYGRSSDKTIGRITSIRLDAVIAYNIGELRFADVFAVTCDDGSPFSESGDSGALIRDASTGAAVGLLIGGTRQKTIACSIGPVLQQLGAKLGVAGLALA